MAVLIRAFSLLLIVLVAAQPAIADTLTITCQYAASASTEGFEKLRKDFVLTFIIDKKTNAAYIVGNAGSNPVTVASGSMGQTTFVETTKSGAMQVTVIDRKLRSAHSRHTIVAPDELLASQFYGACVVS